MQSSQKSAAGAAGASGGDGRGGDLQRVGLYGEYPVESWPTVPAVLGTCLRDRHPAGGAPGSVWDGGPRSLGPEVWI